MIGSALSLICRDRYGMADHGVGCIFVGGELSMLAIIMSPHGALYHVEDMEKLGSSTGARVR